MRRIALALAAASLLAMPAAAIDRYNSEKMTCAKVQATIKADGAAIMRYHSKVNPSLQLYDRYVRDASFCHWNETTVPFWIPSKDDGTCPVFKCGEIDRFEERPAHEIAVPHLQGMDSQIVD